MTDTLTLSDVGFHFGDQDAPVKLTVFTNLACPHCANFFAENETDLFAAIDKKQVELILKPFDKPKEGLLKGNLVHLFLNYKDQEKMNKVILQLFKDQADWKKLSDNEIKTYLTENYGLSIQPDNTDYSLTIAGEAIHFDATSVPTVLLSRDGQTPQKITKDELKKELEAAIPVK
ncbi:thioredoxin domain-containing protein [Sporolactobacillus kofuensis]|uniref:Thioredoxin domain-containing protein n=1 Tax=Sporolactobacillus kofuensis TaxID=269672 RepID=A0ABW1WFJ0_9BACL|nr:thioredoxin domain-containing protein [Sporolactobacillus kofuensis]MCO7175851.1 DsbA family protein [Sporolactobacillus kofuensis]